MASRKQNLQPDGAHRRDRALRQPCAAASFVDLDLKEWIRSVADPDIVFMAKVRVST
jgi:hypothetical protein